MGKTSDHIQAFSLLKTIEVIESQEKAINNLRIHTRRPDIYPFDTVAGEMLCKAFALSRAAIVLVQHGYPDEAFGLCRSLYECSMYLRYITQHENKRDERASKFLQFGVTSKAFWFDLLDKSPHLTQSERQDIHRYKAENKIPDDPKRITQPWSEVRKFIKTVSKESHPTDADTSTEASRLKEKAIAYTDSSCYVHCTQPGLNSYTFDWKELIVIRKSRDLEHNMATKTCMVIQDYLNAVIRYCLFGTGVDSLSELKRGDHTSNDIIGVAGEEG